MAFLWTPEVTGGNFLMKVKFLNDMFIAIGQGTIKISHDGLTWEEKLPPNMNVSLFDVIYQNGLYVISGSMGFIYTSIDGDTWTTQNTNTTEDFSKIAYGNGVFVVGGSNGHIYSSTDCITWSQYSTGISTYFCGVIFRNGMFVTAGVMGTILTSTDGLTWKQITSGIKYDFWNIAYGNGIFVFSSQKNIVTTSDFINFTERINGNNSSYSIHKIDYINGMFIATGSQGFVATSSDGITWTTQNTGSYSEMGGINYINGVYYIASSNGLYTSTDCITWTLDSTTTSWGGMTDVCYGKNKIISVTPSGMILKGSEVLNFLVNGINYYQLDENVNNVSVASNGYSGDIIIPNTIDYNGKTYNVTEIMSQAFNNCSGLTSITLPNTIITIGSEAFGLCTSLTSVTIPESVTTIDRSAFYGSLAIFNVMSERVGILLNNSGVNISKIMLNGVQFSIKVTQVKLNLNNLTLKVNGTATLYPIFTPIYPTNNMVTFSSSNPSVATTNQNGNIIALSNGTTIITCTTDDGGFTDKCIITVTDWEFNSSTNTITKYYGQESNITIPNSINNVPVINIGNMCFDSCTNLISVNLPDSIINVGEGAFRGCRALTNVILQNGITSIGNSAFLNCNVLSMVSIPNSVTSIGDYAFCNCYNMIGVMVLPNNLITIGNNSFYNCARISGTLNIPNGVTSIGNNAFSNCSNIPSMIIPKSVISIGDNAFSNCYKMIWIRVDCSLSVFTMYDSNISGRSEVIKEIFTYYELNAHNSSELPTSPPPTTPSYITHNISKPEVIYNDQVIITWGVSTDTFGSILNYDLYFYDGYSWTLLAHNISNCTFTHTIPNILFNTSTAKYKVVAYNKYLYSNYAVSNTFKMYGSLNSAPIIDGVDKDFGYFENIPTSITYTIEDENYKDIEHVSIEVNNTNLGVFNCEVGKEYRVDLSSIWDSLEENKVNFIKIQAFDGKEYSNLRTYTFKRIFYYKPQISGYNALLGEKYYPFKLTYSIYDKFNLTTLIVQVRIDDIIDNIINNCIRDKVYEMDLSEKWDSLSNGLHTLSITVSDERGNSDTRLYKFYKEPPLSLVSDIDGNDSYLGIKTKPFNCSFVVNDDDVSDKISVMVYLNGKNIDQTYNAIRGFTYNISINSNLFDDLEDNSDHTIEIVVSDGKAINTKRYIFTKKSLEDYITLDVGFDYIMPRFICKQGDNVELKFKIQNLGEDLNLMNYTAKLVALKTDGSIYVCNDITRNGFGDMIVYCDKCLTDLYGVVKFNIIIGSGEKSVSTQKLDLLVIKNIE